VGYRSDRFIVVTQRTMEMLAQDILARAKIRMRMPTIRLRPVKRGRYYRDTHSITLPLWLHAYARMPRYVEWYVAHELAHAVSRQQNHGIRFQRACHRLAPDCYHWEATYKPRMYARMLSELGRTS
jgi:predicted metal-dependent hydrolase